MDGDVEDVKSASERRRHWTTEEKRRIVEQALSSGLFVASLARQHGMSSMRSGWPLQRCCRQNFSAPPH